MNAKTDCEPSLREQLAALEHEQWMRWAQNLRAVEDLSLDRCERWEKLMVPYEQLSELAKDQDRAWADKVLALVEAAARKAAP